jgi:hypothetical protein
MKVPFLAFKKSMQQLSGIQISDLPNGLPGEIEATSVRPHALMTNAEADYLLQCMPDDARNFIRKAPQNRIPGEPPNEFLTRRKFQQRLNYFIEE